jgi:hypothetical protein
MTRNTRHALFIATLVAGAAAVAIQPGEAHKAITSKYTYNDDVFPRAATCRAGSRRCR